VFLFSFARIACFLFFFVHLSCHTHVHKRAERRARNIAGAEALVVARRPEVASREKNPAAAGIRRVFPLSKKTKEKISALVVVVVVVVFVVARHLLDAVVVVVAEITNSHPSPSCFYQVRWHDWGPAYDSWESEVSLFFFFFFCKSFIHTTHTTIYFWGIPLISYNPHHESRLRFNQRCRVRPSDSNLSLLFSKRRNSLSKLAHVHKRSKFTQSGQLVAYVTRLTAASSGTYTSTMG